MKTRTNPSFQHWRLAAAAALLLLAAGSLLPESATAQSVTKDVLLRNIVRDVIVPGYQELAAKSHALTVALEDFTKAPTPESLDRARKAWVAALLASRHIQWLQTGPIADREYIASFCYAKVLPARMEEVLNSSRAIDDSYLAELGATAKGMFALEHLLFGRKSDPAVTNAATVSVLELFSRPESPRRRQYVLALARDLEAKASQLDKDWTAPGDQGAAAKFVASGQDSLNRVVNHLAQLIEQVAEQRINFVLQLHPPISRQFDRIEGSASGTSSQSATALLQGAQKLYRGAEGAGLETYLKHLNAPLAERSQGMFETAIAAVQAIGAPQEDVVSRNRASVEDAYQKTRALEVLCKTDLASALGVTITFTSGDGD